MKVQHITVAFFLLFGLASALSMNGHQTIADFCWKDSYGRGVGVIPTVCSSDRDKIGLLCYSKCPAGYFRSGFDCQQQCPKTGGWADQGLFCRLYEYGRGAGYPWKFGDWFNDNGMIRRCQAANGKGNCQKYGLVYYPKCKAGYYNFGCCICRPSVPNCGAYGMNGNVDLSCAKKLIIGNPIGMGCISTQTYDAGLCYNACQTGYNGVGPVCWKSPPTGWVECGMGAAKDSATCASTIVDQVSSVGNMALNIATFGTGKAATITKDATQAAKLKTQFENLKNVVKANDKIQKAIAAAQGKYPPIEAGKSLGEVLAAPTTTVSSEDIVRVSAQIAALADPSGIADVISAYAYPKCSAITV